MINSCLTRLFFRLRDNLWPGRRGSVSVMAAVLLPAMAGMTGLGVEYGRAMMTQVEDQRVADLAAYGGALAYNATTSTATMSAAVGSLTTMNGLPSSAATVRIVSSPSGDGNSAVQVTVSNTVPMTLSSLLGAAATVLPVSAVAYVELVPGVTTTTTAGCIIALSSTGTGITLSGGTVVSAPACTLATNTSLTVPNGTSVTTPIVNFVTNVDGSTAPTTDANIHPPTGHSSVTYTRASTSDPLSGNTVISAAISHLTTVSSQAAPTVASVSTGPDLNFGYYPTTLNAGGCSGTLSGNTWSFTCPAAGTYAFGAINLQGGLSLNFNVGGASSSTYTFSSQLTNQSGTTMNFGPGTYKMAAGLNASGGATTSFGAGTFLIGTGSCGYSICQSGNTMTIAGPSSFTLPGGINVGGGATLVMGSGTSNSYKLGAGSSGNAFYLGGSAVLTMADATSGVFQVNGTVNAASGGGSCLTLPAAAQHDINGSFTSAGGTVMGAGVYSINGYFALGAGGGGDVSCSGAQVGVSGNAVSLVVSGSVTATGACNGYAFCVAAGFNHVTMVAPSSGATNSLLVIGPSSSSRIGGAAFTEGAASTSLSGIFYFPYGQVWLGGGASIGNGTSQCLELIGTQITLTGGTTAATTCTGLGGNTVATGSVATARLVK